MAEYSQPQNTDFEILMANGVIAHARHYDDRALVYRQDALQLAETDEEKGRALRDMSASYSKLGQPDEAYAVADGSVVILEGQPESREYAASLAHKGRLMVKMTTSYDLRGIRSDPEEQQILYRKTSSADELLGNAVAILERLEAKHTEKPEQHRHDQYKINALGRLAAAQVVAGKRSEAIKTGFESLKLSFKSESPNILHSNLNISPLQRLRAKVMHAGVAGLAIISAVSPSQRLRLITARKAVA